MLVDVAATQRESELRAQIAQLLSTNTQLVSEIAKLNDRVAELLAIAQRKQRKTAAPSEKKPEPPPIVEAAAQQAFDARPTPPALPEKIKTPKSPKRTGRNAIPQHLEVEVRISRSRERSDRRDVNARIADVNARIAGT